MQIDEQGFWMNELRKQRRRRWALLAAVTLGVAAVAGAVVLLRATEEPEPGPRAASLKSEPARERGLMKVLGARSTTPTFREGDLGGELKAALPKSKPASRETARSVLDVRRPADEEGRTIRMPSDDGPPLAASADRNGRATGEARGVGGLGVRGAGRGGGAGLRLSRVGSGKSGRIGGHAAESSGYGSAGFVPRGTRGEVSLGGGEIVTKGHAVRGEVAALVVPKKKTARRLGIKSRSRSQPGLPLRASATDDNVTFDEFERFLSSWGDRAGTRGYEHVHVRDRKFVRVLDAEGRPVPAAKVTVRASGETLWTGQTHGDGRTALYARSGFRARPQGAVEVEAEIDGRLAQGIIEEGETTLRLETPTPRPQRIPLDVCFLIDTTGSMEDEINRIKATLLTVTERVRKRHPGVDLRYGAVLYRDRGDAYVTRKHAFTRDIRAFDRLLERIEANGGGDTPESLNAGLAQAVNALKWRTGAAKVAFLIADAAPHMDYANDTTYGVSMRRALAKGIRIHAVAASGLSQLGTLIFRQIAQYTRGKFIFIQYGSVAASKAKHGVKSQVESNDLDVILFDRIDAEVSGWGR